MPTAGGPQRLVTVVVSGFAFVFVGVLIAVQFGDATPAGLATLPLFLAIPVAIAVAYWALRNR